MTLQNIVLASLNARLKLLAETAGAAFDAVAAPSAYAGLAEKSLVVPPVVVAPVLSKPILESRRLVRHVSVQTHEKATLQASVGGLHPSEGICSLVSVSSYM